MRNENENPGPAVIREKETARVEAFSDGVFSIALTLLILDIQLPHPGGATLTGNRELFGALLQLWPSFVAFVLSFGTVLIMWVNHHELFKNAFRVDRRLMFTNGFLLLIVTFVPFPTAVLADYLNKPGANAAAAFYCGTYVLINIGYNLLLWGVYTSSHPARTADESEALTKIRKTYRLAFLVYGTATVVALFSAYAGLAICLSLWVNWARLRYLPDRHPM